MTNPTPSQAGALRAQTSIGKLLEETKLSRLAPLPNRSACSVCDNGRLDKDNEFQQAVKICRKCLAQFAKTASVLDEHADEKARAAKLQRFALAMER